ncbi:MAG: hypothetical protein KBB54_00155 [Candidatus Pacebacteria bacterium]|nr:hypothetical protein [Candidatus Paceibacterota bacterium]MBP9818641.1 hypothetical protein [Candidatus Paceibacterota bacterium]
MVHKDENGKLNSVTTVPPVYGPDGTEYVTMGFMMEFKNDLLEILEMRFNAIDGRFEMIEKKIDESNTRIDRLISQNALEHHSLDIRIASQGA